MAIYLDTNSLYGWYSFAELDRLALAVVAAQLGQAVVLPTMVVDEAAGQYRRALDVALDDHDVATRKLSRLFLDDIEAYPEPYPDADAALATWHERLRQFATIVPTTPAHAMEGLQREIDGRPPAKPRVAKRHGEGGRDAAIWATIAEHHRQAGEPGYLITADQAFGGDERLADELDAEIDGANGMTLFSDVAGFIARLGARSPTEVAVGQLGAAATDAVRDELKESSAISDAVWERADAPVQKRARVTHVQPTEVRAAHRFDAGGEEPAVLLVESVWEIRADILYRHAGEPVEDDAWFVMSDWHLGAIVHLYLTDGRAEVIRTEVRTSKTAHLYPDGRILTVGSQVD